MRSSSTSVSMAAARLWGYQTILVAGTNNSGWLTSPPSFASMSSDDSGDDGGDDSGKESRDKSTHYPPTQLYSEWIRLAAAAAAAACVEIAGGASRLRARQWFGVDAPKNEFIFVAQGSTIPDCPALT